MPFTLTQTSVTVETPPLSRRTEAPSKKNEQIPEEGTLNIPSSILKALEGSIIFSSNLIPPFGVYTSYPRRRTTNLLEDKDSDRK